MIVREVADGLVAIGSRDGHVYGLEAKSGRERFRFATGAAVWSSPAMHGGLVIFGSDDHHVYALDTRMPDGWQPTKAQLETAIQGHVLAQAELMDTYKKER